MLITTTALVLMLLGSNGTALRVDANQVPVAQGQEPAKEKQDPDKEKKKEGEKEKAGKDAPKEAGAEGAWMTDHKTALAAAKKGKKPVLMVFTGSDWCPPCKKLHSDVFESEAFKTWAAKKVVLLELDFPRKKELPKEQKEHNDKLKDEFKVTGFPTVVALDAKGTKLFQQVGFSGASVDDWIKAFEKELGKK